MIPEFDTTGTVSAKIAYHQIFEARASLHYQALVWACDRDQRKTEPVNLAYQACVLESAGWLPRPMALESRISARHDDVAQC